jgi:hypothetical protein
VASVSVSGCVARDDGQPTLVDNAQALGPAATTAKTITDYLGAADRGPTNN